MIIPIQGRSSLLADFGFIIIPYPYKTKSVQKTHVLDTDNHLEKNHEQLLWMIDRNGGKVIKMFNLNDHLLQSETIAMSSARQTYLDGRSVIYLVLSRNRNKVRNLMPQLEAVVGTNERLKVVSLCWLIDTICNQTVQATWPD